MRSRLNVSSFAAGILALLLAAVAFGKVKEGEKFPPIKAPKLGRKGEFDFASLAGKVAIIDLWASWCEPCKVELPALNEIHKKHAAKGLVVVGVNVDDKEADATAFLSSRPVAFPIVYDGAKKAIVSRVEPTTMPTSLIVGRDGKIVRIHRGFRSGDQEKIEKEALALLK